MPRKKTKKIKVKVKKNKSKKKPGVKIKKPKAAVRPKKTVRKLKAKRVKKIQAKKISKSILAPIKGQRIEVKLIKDKPVAPLLATTSASLLDQLRELVKNNGQQSEDDFKDFNFDDQIDLMPPADALEPLDSFFVEVDMPDTNQIAESEEDDDTIYVRTRWVDKLSPRMKKFVLYSSLASVAAVLFVFSVISIKNSLGQTFSATKEDLKTNFAQSGVQESIDNLTKGVQNIGNNVQENTEQKLDVIEQLRTNIIEQKMKQEALDSVKEQLIPEPTKPLEQNTNINQ